MMSVTALIGLSPTMVHKQINSCFIWVVLVTTLLFFFYMNTELLLPPAVSALGSIVGGVLNARAQEHANEINQENFEKALKFNREEAHASRMQQSISNQLREMRVGGINPVSGNVTVASSPSFGTSPNLPQIHPVDSLGTSISQSSLNAAQVANIAANTRKTEEETEGQKQTNKILSSDAAFRDALNREDLNLRQGNVSLVAANTKSILEQLPEQVSLLRAQTKQALELAASQENVRANLDSLTKLNGKNLELATEQIKTEVRKQFLMKSEELLNNAKTDETRQHIKNLVKEIEKMDVEIGLDGVKTSLYGLECEIKPAENDAVRLQYNLDAKNPTVKWLVGLLAPLVGSTLNAVSRVAAAGM